MVLGVGGLSAGVACGGGSGDVDDSTSTSGSGAGSTSSAGGMGGGTTSAGGSMTTSTGGAGTGGGEGGAPPVWPTCDTQPSDVPAKTINEIWSDDPAMPEPVGVAGVYVTAVSASGCGAGNGCQIFVQQAETFPNIAAGSQQALKLFASPATAMHFEGIAVGDQIDILAHAWRYDVGGQNELLLQVANNLPGCAKVVGTGTPLPVEGLVIEDLTVELYEQTMGPLLVKIDAVSGSPDMPNELFGLWPAFNPGTQPLEEVTSLSPYMLPGSVFVGLQQDLIHNFESITGVFSLFVPPQAPPTKFEVLYIRSMDDAVVGGT